MDHKLHETYRLIEREHWWFVGRREILFDALKKFAKPDAKILDVGCNSGVAVGILQERGYDAYGTDLDEGAIAAGTARGIKNLKVATGNRQPFDDATFDVVLALDVIEHIDDDHAAVREMKRVLKPGGIMIIKVPAFKFLWGLQDEVAHHKRRYTKESLAHVLTSEGLELKRTTYFNTFLFMPITAVRMLQKLIPPKRASDFELNNPTINKILTKVFTAESRMLRTMNMPFGISVLAIAKNHEA
jgi:SAM-dependent methyltransferase